MAKPAAAVMTTRRHSRATLLRSTALQAVVGLVVVTPVSAQPAPGARPQGGQVVAGAAAIATTANATNITQSTSRAAIDWRSFDVGSSQSVNFQQPSSAAVTLNRVTGGDPSAIAGKINANGQIILTNPSGVTFFQGAQVNAQSVVVSAAGISNQNFMAGKMVFDQAANPNARVENRGTITVKQAGLAALVAPSVANFGVINARLGQVVLAGAAAHTLDMHGDGLVSIDVTKQVTQAPIGPDGKAVTALVTNSGTIRADGGVVQLTASAADGVVQTLVRAGGTIRANSVGARTGRIEITGTGGSVVVEGRVAADGRAPGTVGGQVMVAASDTTSVAATARVSANGKAGGGTVAIGTSLARARGTGAAPAGTSARALIASGARVSADAIEHGDGGRITVLSTATTNIAGALSARGGKTGGNGGTIEMSGEQGFRLSGAADTSAPHGAVGTIVLDPRDLTIADTQPGSAVLITAPAGDPNIGYGTPDTATDAYVTPTQLNQLTGDLHLQASRDLIVASNLNHTGSVTLDAGRNLTVNAGVALQSSGNITLNAAAASSPSYNSAGTLTINGTVTAANAGLLTAGTGGIAIANNVTMGGSLRLATPGAVVQTGGVVSTTDLFGTAGSVSLVGANAITGIGVSGGGFATSAGGFAVTTSGSLTAGPQNSGTPPPNGTISVPTGQTILLGSDNLTIGHGSNAAGVATLSAPGGTVVIQPYTNTVNITLTSSTKPAGLALTTGELALISTGTLKLGSVASPAASITLGQSGETIDLITNSTIRALAVQTGQAVSQGGPLLVNTLSGNANSIDLSNAGNTIPNIASLTAAQSLSLATNGNMTLSGATTAGAVLSLTAGGALSIPAGATASGGAMVLSAGAEGISIIGGVNSGSGSLSISTTGLLTDSNAGQITTPSLQGSAGNVSLTSQANLISGIGINSTPFNVMGTNGDFVLATRSSNLTIGNNASPAGGISVQSGRTIALAADALTIAQALPPSSGGIATLSAPSGTLALTPFTSTNGILLTGTATSQTGVLVITTGTTGALASTTEATLQLGAALGSLAIPSGIVTIGSGTETVDLGRTGFNTTGPTTLSFQTAGLVTQAAGGQLAVGTISGQAGTLSLLEQNNFIGTLNGFTTTSGDLAFHTGSGLTVSGEVIANGGIGNVTLSSADVVSGDVGMSLGANIRGSTVSLNSVNPSPTGGISQTGGVITATTLTGAGYYATLNGNNVVGQLDAFAVTTELSLTTTIPLSITGAVSTTTGAVTLNAPGITQTATSSIAAPVLNGGASATTLLNSRLNTVAGVNNFDQTAGDFTLVTSSPVLTLASNSGTIQAASGSINFVADGVALAPSSSGGISALQGIVGFAPFTANRRIELIGSTAADPASLSVGGPLLAQVAALRLALGDASSTGAVNIANANETVDLTGRAGTLQLRTTGAVTEGVSPGGQNGGGTLALNVGNLTGSVGNLALAAPANQISKIGYSDGIVGESDGLQAAQSLAVQSAASLSVTNAVTASASTGTLTIGTAGSLTLLPTTLSANTVTLTASGTSTDSGGTLTQTTGSITAGATLTLNASGLASQTGGTISAASLTGATGSLSLTQPGNVIQAVSGATSGPVSITDSVGMSIGSGVVFGDTTLTIAGALQVTGAATFGALALNVTGAATMAPMSQLAATSLAGSADSVTFQGSNTVATLGSFTSVNGFSLVDGQALTVAGPVTDGRSVSLSTSGGLTVSGAVTAPMVSLATTGGALLQTAGAVTGSTSVTLTSSGTIGQSGGTIATATLSGSSGGTTGLGSAGNAVGTLAGFASVGGFSLANGQALTVAGPVTDSTSVALAVSGGLTLAGTVQTGALSLTASGAITQPGGNLVAASLSGGGAGVTLTQRGNQVGSLGGFASSVDFALTDSVAVTVSGAVSAGSGRTLTLVNDAPSFGTGGLLSAPGGTVVLAEYTAGKGITVGGGSGLTGTPPVTATTLTIGAPTGGPVTIAGAFNLSTVSVLDLESGGTITETGAGAIRVGTLTGRGASAALGGGNQVVTLGSFATTGGFGLTNAQGLTLGGPLTASAASLSIAGDLVVAGSVTAPGSVSMVASGRLSQSAGGITTTSLSGSAASATLGSAANTIGTLAGFTTTNGFALRDGQSLIVAGAVSGAQVALSVTGDLGVNGVVTGGPVSLVATGAMSEGSGGKIVADTLTGSANAASFGNPNQVVTLGSFATTGGFGLSNAQGLTLGGPLTASTASLSITGDLVVAGSVTAPGSVSLVASGRLSQSAGGITTASLSGSAASATLGSTANAIGTLAGFTTTNGFALTDGQSLTVAGPVTDSTSVALAVSGGLTLAGTVQTGALSLTASGAITQPGGSLVAASLSGSGAGVALTQRGNQVGNLGGFASAADFALTDGVAVTVSGAVSAGSGRTLTLLNDAPSFGTGGSLAAPGGTVVLAEYTAGNGITVGGGSGLSGTPPVTATTLTIGSPTGGPVTIAGAFNLSTVATLDLESGGLITETGSGAIRVGTLTGRGASAALGGGNQIVTLGSFATTGGFGLTNAQGLTLGGPLTASTASLSIAGDLVVAGSVTAPGSVSLVASGRLSQSAGGITTASLSGSAASATLGSASNAIGTLAGFTTTNGFALTDAQSLMVAGAVSGVQVALSVAGDLGVNGVVTGGPVSLVATGAITEGSGGKIVAGTLTGSANAASFGNPNQVVTLGSFATTGGFGLTNAQGLTLGGPLTASTASLSVTGDLVVAGSVTAPVSVSLVASGRLSQSAGGITTASLSGSAASATLGSAANAIGTLAGFTTANGFALTDGQSLTVAGPLTDRTSVALAVSGGLTLAGTVQTGALSLTASGAITQPGGSLVATSLSGSGAGVALTQRGNQIGNLGGFASAADFALTDGVAVTVSGAVSAGSGRTLTLVNDAPSFGMGGSLSVPGGTVVLAEYTAGKGITIGTGGSLSATPAVSAATLVIGAPTGGPVTITDAFNLASVATLDLESSGAITETGAGAIKVGTLTGRGASVALGGANQIGTLAGFATTGAFALTDTASLALTGTLSAATVRLLSGGDLNLAASITAPSSVVLLASGAITQPGGAITTASLSGSATSASLGSTGNAVATLAGFNTTGDFTLFDGRSLTVSAPVDPNTVTLTVLGDLTINSSITGGTVVLNATGRVAEGQGGQVVATLLTGAAGFADLGGGNLVATLGDFQTTGSLSLNNGQSIALAGAVSGGQGITIGSAGGLAISGTLAAPVVTLTARGGAITQTAGMIAATNAAGLTAAGGISLGGAVTIGSETQGGLTLLAGGPVALGGTLSTGGMSFTTPGAVTQTGGSLTVAGLTGSAGGQVTLGTAGVARILGINDTMSATGITLVDSSPLQLFGTVAAPTLAIIATGQISLNDGVIRTNGLALTQQAASGPSLTGSYFQVLPGSDGAASLRQTGITTVQPYSGGASTLRFDLPSSSASLNFNALNAGRSDIVLSLGSGKATGTLNVANLTVLASGGTAEFGGVVGGRSSIEAAQQSKIFPLVSNAYTLNGCAIGAASCSTPDFILTAALQGVVASAVRPDILTLDVLDMTVNRDRDDPTLLLPNISDRDY